MVDIGLLHSALVKCVRGITFAVTMSSAPDINIQNLLRYSTFPPQGFSNKYDRSRVDTLANIIYIYINTYMYIL